MVQNRHFEYGLLRLRKSYNSGKLNSKRIKGKSLQVIAFKIMYPEKYRRLLDILKIHFKTPHAPQTSLVSHLPPNLLGTNCWAYGVLALVRGALYSFDGCGGGKRLL
jgi:hypothetical protein